MATAGRPPKPLEHHARDGTFRAHRHAGMAGVKATGKPVCPRCLSGEARKFWTLVVPELTQNGTVKRLDTAAVQAACETWALYRAAYQEAIADPLDKAARCAVVSYLALWERLAAKLGLSPVDRARLRADDGGADEDPRLKLLDPDTG